MNNLSIRNILLFSFLLVYSYLFWKQNLGINIGIFTCGLLAAMFYLNPNARKSKPAIFTAIGTVFCALFGIIHHTTISFFIFFVSFFIATGFIHLAEAKYIPFNLLQTLYSYLHVPIVWVEGISKTTNKQKQLSLVWRFVKRGIIPFVIFFIFYMIYSVANPVFGNLASMFSDKIFLIFEELFKYISLPYFFFILLGLILLTGIFYYKFNSELLGTELSLPDFLKRKTKPFPKVERSRYYTLPEPNPVGLRNENRSAVWLLVLVNSLLLIVNCIDISWIWFGFNMPANFNLKNFVHEGTYLLILSILLSMGLLLFYFRGNLNFYAKNTLLQQLAYIWIVQNMVLTFSVFLRNWHYIQYHGLAYKRIGVIVFLLLTLVGLVTLYFKIRDKKTNYFLWRTNTWTTYTALVIMCAFHWDVIIVKYNLNHTNIGGIDTDFYYELSTSTIPIFYENLDKVERQMVGQKSLPEPWAYRTEIGDFKKHLETKSNYFLMDEESDGWQSWNLADAKTSAYLKKNKSTYP